MRHGAVAYFDADGRPVPEDDVPLTATGPRAGAKRRARCSTASSSTGSSSPASRAPPRPPPSSRRAHAAETWPELRELKGAKLTSIPAGRARGCVRARVPRRRAEREAVPRRREHRRALRPRRSRRRAPRRGRRLGHRARRRPRRRQPRDPLVRTDRRAHASSAASSRPPDVSTCSTSTSDGEWIVRAVNVAASDLVHGSTRLTTMEQYWAQYRAAPEEPPDTESELSDLGSPRRRTSASRPAGTCRPVNFAIRSHWIGS